VRTDPPLFNSNMDREQARHRSERRGRQVLDRASASLPALVQVEKRMEQGHVVTTLSNVADEEGAALIVVGSRGRGRVASALRESVSQALAREAPCPVMIVPDARTDLTGLLVEASRPRPTMIASTDGSAASSAAARFAGELAAGLDHRLVVVHLRDRAGKRADALQAVSRSEDARMIVIAAEDGDRRRLALGRSLAARLTRLVGCPVMVVPSEATIGLGDLNDSTHGAAPEAATGG